MNRLILIMTLVLLVPAVSFAQINWTKNIIESTFGGARSVYVIDLDGDEDNDVLAAAFTGHTIAWWENDGYGDFSLHTIDGDFDGASSVFAIDLDGDTDNDVLGASSIADDIMWWKNDGSGNFTKDTIDFNFDGASSVFAIDLDGDTDNDVLGAGDSVIAWWENDGDGNFITKNTIDDTLVAFLSVYAIDLDGDTDNDVLGTALSGYIIAWWKNDGAGNFTKDTVTTSFTVPMSVYAIDLDGDTDNDVLGASLIADDIMWWKNDGGGNFTKDTIDFNFDGASSVFAIDLDGDTDNDVLGASSTADDIVWWQNDGNENWAKDTIDDDFDGACSVFAIDLDNDGDVDVLGAGSDSIFWWESDLLDLTDVGPVSIDIPSQVPEDTTFQPKATFANFGTEPKTFPVTCTIEPGAYTKNQTIWNLAPHDSIQVTFFAPFIFTNGIYTVTVYTRLTDDENLANDTLVKIVETYDPGITEGNTVVPAIFSFGLKNNPTKGKALFDLSLPHEALISLWIYDVSGRLVDRVISGRHPAGTYQIPWTKDVGSGIFFYHLDSPWRQKVGKLVLLK